MFVIPQLVQAPMKKAGGVRVQVQLAQFTTSNSARRQDQVRPVKFKGLLQIGLIGMILELVDGWIYVLQIPTFLLQIVSQDRWMKG